MMREDLIPIYLKKVGSLLREKDLQSNALYKCLALFLHFINKEFLNCRDDQVRKSLAEELLSLYMLYEERFMIIGETVSKRIKEKTIKEGNKREIEQLREEIALESKDLEINLRVLETRKKKELNKMLSNLVKRS